MADLEHEIRLLASYLCVSCGKLSTNKQLQMPVLVENGSKVQGLATIAKHLAKKNNNTSLFGRTPVEEAAVNQWLEYRVTQVDRCAGDKDVHTLLQEMNTYLADKVYFVGHTFTLADLLLYYGLHCIFRDLAFFEKQKYMHVSRWFDQVQHNDGVRQDFGTIHFQKNLIYSGFSH